MPALDQAATSTSPRSVQGVLEGTLTTRRGERWALVDGAQQLLGPLIGAAGVDIGARICVVVSQDGTPFLVWPRPEASIVSGTWNWTTSHADAAPGRVGIDATTWAAATVVYLSKTLADGTALTGAALQTGDRMRLEQSDDGTRFGRYQLAAPGTDHGTYISYPVTFLQAGTGAPPTNNRPTTVTLGLIRP